MRLATDGKTCEIVVGHTDRPINRNQTFTIRTWAIGDWQKTAAEALERIREMIGDLREAEAHVEEIKQGRLPLITWRPRDYSSGGP